MPNSVISDRPVAMRELLMGILIPGGSWCNRPARGGGYETRLTSYSNLEVTAGKQIVDALLGLASRLQPGAIPVPSPRSRMVPACHDGGIHSNPASCDRRGASGRRRAIVTRLQL